jgi:hypothetical protein
MRRVAFIRGDSAWSFQSSPIRMLVVGSADPHSRFINLCEWIVISVESGIIELLSHRTANF